MRAYKKYQKNVTSHKTSDPKALFELKAELLKYGIYTESDVKEIAELGEAGDSRNMPAIAGILFRIKDNFKERLSRDKRDEFRTLMNRYIGLFNYIQVLYRIPHPELWDFQIFQIFLIYLNHKLSNTDFNSLMKEIMDVKVINYAIPEFDAPGIIKEDEGEREEKYNGCKKTKTVKEVIAEINLKFSTLITDEGVEAVGSYLEAVTQDEDIKDIIRSNKMKDPEMVYQTIIQDKMQASLQDFIMDGIGKGIYSSSLYEKITSDNVMPFINKTVYNLIRENLKAA